ncbi:MAG: DUF1631 family protein [Marinobacter sp.]|uniref:DUF1631 family protein n=1 Tax=Marinobacter sp. TaxID=50741 RepID=UPI00299E828B|nr:DUF1631 family protein [Marinobacter sp.]MDX1754970.1 DUF1631 family protein [Marinobacter sp.]
MPEQAITPPSGDDQATIQRQINDILTGIRVPGLPYPIGQVEEDRLTDWRPLLLSCWNEQRDESVTHLLQSVSLNWSVRQVNSAYIADRIMDVFLKTCGLHVLLAERVARLRYFLAWRLAEDSAMAFEDSIRGWLDSLGEWRGWSDSGGRSARTLLDQLDAMVIAVSASFEAQGLEPFEVFCSQWARDAQARKDRVGKLRERLLVTEQGAARQRRAEQTSRALVGRALSNRELPEAISSFVLNDWIKLLRQIVASSGVEGEDWRHASKLLEWLVWIGDPTLSDGSTDRLYHVGEQIGERLNEVWQRVFGQPLPQQSLASVEAVIVERLRGETPELAPALAGARKFEFDPAWLTLKVPAESELAQVRGQWYVEGAGAGEQRRFFLAFLEDTCEVIWSNGFGVKLGLMPWAEFVQARSTGALKPIPPLNHFQDVLRDSVVSLAKVQDRQRRQREQAARDAKARAEALRQKVEAAEQAKRQELESRRREQERLEAEEQQQRQQQAEEEQRRIEQERHRVAQEAVESLKLGGWVAFAATDPEQKATRMKLAVRINASRKLVFVDRLGLNRQEFQEDALVQEVAAGRVRVLSGGSAEFDDTLSRVVGRIRVGR